MTLGSQVEELMVSVAQMRTDDGFDAAELGRLVEAVTSAAEQDSLVALAGLAGELESRLRAFSADANSDRAMAALDLVDEVASYASRVIAAVAAGEEPANVAAPTLSFFDGSEESDTEQSDTEQSDTEQSDTEQSDTEQSDTEQSDTEQSDTEQGQANEAEDTPPDDEESDESSAVEDYADDVVDPEMLELFTSSCNGFLSDIEGQALDIENQEDPSESLEEVRRAIHTLKGESGVLSLSVLQELCHEAETMMDRCMEGGVDFPVDAILALVDYTKQYVERIAEDPRAVPLPYADLLQRLCETGASGESSESPTESTAEFTAETATEAADVSVAQATVPSQPSGGGGQCEGVLTDADNDGRVVLIVDPDFADSVQDFLVESASHLADAEAAMLEFESGQRDPEQINVTFRAFHTIKGVAGFLGLKAIVEVAHSAETLMDMGRSGTLDFAYEEVDLVLRSTDMIAVLMRALEGDGPAPMLAAVNTHIDRLDRACRGSSEGGDSDQPSQSAGAESVASAWTAAASAPPIPQAQPAPESQAAAAAASAPPGEASSAETAEPSSTTDSAKKRSRLGSTIKVNTTRLDMLVDMVGELVIGQTMVLQDPALTDIKDQALQRNIGLVSKITRDLQESAMSLRMVTLKSTFQKMARLVRDVSSKSGKRVNLTILGEDTELDRNVVEEIGDPLVHMLRNAVDHGLESPGEREAAGKPETGELVLNAYHQGGSIVIELSDDGRGIDRDKVLAKAKDRGLVSPDVTREDMTDAQVVNLVFQPGFSTAEAVTDLSGRGVGMDVVRRNLEALRGKVEIDTKLGEGSVFRMMLPLTLAIIDGMVVRVGNQRFVIPTHAIEQSFRPKEEDVHYMQDEGEMVSVRGRVLSIAPLKYFFWIESGTDSLAEGILIILEAGEQRSCLLVDEILGQQQVVIKSLGVMTSRIPGVSGGAIMGDGRVALIVDVATLMQQATEAVY